MLCWVVLTTRVIMSKKFVRLILCLNSSYSSVISKSKEEIIGQCKYTNISPGLRISVDELGNENVCNEKVKNKQLDDTFRLYYIE